MKLLRQNSTQKNLLPCIQEAQSLVTKLYDLFMLVPAPFCCLFVGICFLLAVNFVCRQGAKWLNNGQATFRLMFELAATQNLMQDAAKEEYKCRPMFAKIIFLFLLYLIMQKDYLA